MIRILIDELGDGHDDIILKIDTMPALAQIGDLYYMADFLRLAPDIIDKVPDYLGVEYLKYVKDKFDKLDDSEAFIIFDISDQYIGGLLVSKGEKGLIQTYYGMTMDIHGYEIDKDVLDRLIDERKPTFERQGDWLLSIDSIINGLDWNINKLKKNGSEQ